MRNIIENKLKEINKEMSKCETGNSSWKLLNAKKQVLEEVLKTDERGNKIMLLKENQNDWDMGLIIRDEYEGKINQINKQ